jgi:hypothetical protein
MLGNAITTELQLLAAKDRVADLAAAFRPSRTTGSVRDGDAPTDLEAGLPSCLEHGSLGRPAAVGSDLLV